MISHLLNTEVTNERASTVPDGAGGYTEEWSTVGANPAMVSQPSPVERQTAQQYGVDLTHIVYMNYGADVARGDRFTDDFPTVGINGRPVRVVSVINNSRASYTKVECGVTQGA